MAGACVVGTEARAVNTAGCVGGAAEDAHISRGLSRRAATDLRRPSGQFCSHNKRQKKESIWERRDQCDWGLERAVRLGSGASGAEEEKSKMRLR